MGEEPVTSSLGEQRDRKIRSREASNQITWSALPFSWPTGPEVPLFTAAPAQTDCLGPPAGTRRSAAPVKGELGLLFRYQRKKSWSRHYFTPRNSASRLADGLGNGIRLYLHLVVARVFGVNLELELDLNGTIPKQHLFVTLFC